MKGSKPVLLTTTDGLIEDQTSVALSADGKTFYYCTNAKDIDRRHIWAVPVAGGTPRQVTGGIGIETWPTPLASGKQLATQSADWKRPQSIGVWNAGVRVDADGAEVGVPDGCAAEELPDRPARRADGGDDKAADGVDVLQPAVPAEGLQAG